MTKKKHKLTKEQYEKLCFIAQKFDIEILGKETELEDLKIEIADMKKDYKAAMKIIEEYRAKHKGAHDD